MRAPSDSARQTRRQALRLGAALGLGALPGCALPQRLAAVPRADGSRATVLGLPNERFRIAHPDQITALEHEFAAAAERQRRHLGLASGALLPRLDLLAISGGGENGAFGAGLLNGWTQHGDRPTFDLVTGVSTGALTAPFAFLGPEWDADLKRVYTDISPERVLIRRWFTAALFDDALADNSPLFETISGYLDERMIAAIARGYREGRLLLAASADIDAQTPVIWNLGAIADSGHPRALETIRRVLLASAAIPGAFPPVMFDVAVDGRPHQEMHVDGGAFVQAFLYPSAVTQARREAIARGRRVSPARAFIIRNGRLDAEWSAVERRTVSIAGRAVSTMISSAGYQDTLRIYFVTQRDGVDYNLAFIRPDFAQEFTTPFDQAYMRALFDYAFELGARGYEWTKMPPGLA
ncbi:patatin-like phospholipase family protein [Falsiroseomonas oryziterrae]|uniref:patatin-like phospholipase family protein n=1 Tax=Falsiroseomonas oryziterrae TaxID=2911368 RepID=UPI001F00E5E5|nr:patatin-like phospholipase family protein [Roseomonas sp. NPKOSM-4]